MTRFARLGVEAEKDSEFRKVPGSLLLTFPVEHAAEAIDFLKDGLNSFVDCCDGAGPQTCQP